MPHRVFIGPLANYGYEGETLLRIPVTVPAAQAAGGVVKVSAKAQWLVCREVCIPGEATLNLELPVRDKAGPAKYTALFERAARETPKPGTVVRAGRSAARLTLAFERDSASSAEFFPYREGWLEAPAPQPLYRDPGQAGRWWVELKALATADDAALAKAGFGGGPVGVLVLDGEPHEVSARLDGPALAGGTLVSTAKRDENATSVLSSGAGARLLSGIGSPFGSGAASAASWACGGQRVAHAAARARASR